MKIIIIVLILTSCSNYHKLEPSGDHSSTDYFISTTDSAVKAANLPILRNLPLDSGITEIRIWTGFGSLIIQDMYRIYVLESGQIDGEYIWYFDAPLDYWELNEKEEFYNETYKYCNKIGAFEKTESCLVKLDKNVDWNGIYNGLIKLDIWNMPDNSEIPKYQHKDSIVTLDGSHIIVELKKNGYYRSFGHRLSPAPFKKKYQFGQKIMDVLSKELK